MTNTNIIYVIMAKYKMQPAGYSGGAIKFKFDFVVLGLTCSVGQQAK